MIKRVAISDFGAIYEVTDMFDRFANPTQDPSLAITCVLKQGESEWKAQDATDIPIYTVH